MFKKGPSYQKLKTNLRLAVNRLKMLEKKKSELSMKARKEIADYIKDGKIERARIRVEQIIREDYIVEAMEIVEMYCDLLSARFGLIQQMRELDPGLAEAISSIIWIELRLVTDVPELKLISDQLILKYGKEYGAGCKTNSVGTVSPKLMQKISVQAPPKLIVEKYLVEIAKIYDVDYEPDRRVFEEANDNFISERRNSNDSNDLGGGAAGGSGGAGGGGISAPPMQMHGPQQPGFIGYPHMPIPAGAGGGKAPLYSNFKYPSIPPMEKEQLLKYYQEYDQKTPELNFGVPPPPKYDDYFEPMAPADKELFVCQDNNYNHPPPQPAPRASPRTNLVHQDLPSLSVLPSVRFQEPENGSDTNNNSDDNNDIEFDDLTRRFEELKRRE